MKLYPQGTKALEPLGELFKSTLLAVERRLKWAKAQDMTYNILDLAMLRIVEHISWQLLTEADATPSSVGVPALLDLCIEGVRSKFLLIHTPYKVLEDLTEGQTISTCELLWDLMVTRKDKLTTVRIKEPLAHGCYCCGWPSHHECVWGWRWVFRKTSSRRPGRRPRRRYACCGCAMRCCGVCPRPTTASSAARSWCSCPRPLRYRSDRP